MESLSVTPSQGTNIAAYREGGGGGGNSALAGGRKNNNDSEIDKQLPETDHQIAVHLLPLLLLPPFGTKDCARMCCAAAAGR